MLACACYATAQQQSVDAVIVNMVDQSPVTAEDTALRKFHINIQRFFNRNLRMPRVNAKLVQGYATVSFVVGNDRKTVKPELLSMTNDPVGKEALRVAKKLSDTPIEPLYRNGKPVVAKVKISICFVTEETYSATEEEIKSKAGILVIGYPPVH